MQPVHIYVMCDPNTKEVRYVGQSSDVKSRAFAHSRAFGPLGDWVRGLIADGTPPVVLIVATISIPKCGTGNFCCSTFLDVVRGAERTLIEKFHRFAPGELLNKVGLPPKGKSSFACDREAEFPRGEVVEVWTVKPQHNAVA